jgi:C4-dicarboxylate transporter DctM subunit
MDTTSAILILAPILYPVAAAYGVNIIHFGLIMVINLSIGFITPPLGVNLFVACGIGKMPFTDIVKKIMPFLIVLIIALIVITYIPGIVLLLPNFFAN